MILTVCLNPVIQRTLFFEDLLEGEVNRAVEQFIHASGKGVNVSRVLSQLETEVLHLTHAGGSQKDFFLELCKNDKFPVVYANSQSEIRSCITVINNHKHTVTELVEEGLEVSPETESRIRELFNKELSKLDSRRDCLVISGTKSRGYSDELYPWMTSMAQKKEIKVILDLKGDDLKNSLSFRPAWIKPNLQEFAKTFCPDITLREEEDNAEIVNQIIEKALVIHKKTDVNILLTQGSRGVHLVYMNEYKHFESQSLIPVNTIGCGDAFTAGFTSAIMKNQSTSLDNITTMVTFAQECASKNALSKTPGSLF